VRTFYLVRHFNTLFLPPPCFNKYLDKPERIIVGGQVPEQVPDYFGVGGGFEAGIPRVRFH